MTEKQIKDIAGDLDCGLKCFVHVKTKEIKVIPDFDRHPDIDSDAWADAIDDIDNNFGDYIEIKGMDPHDSFRLMEDFVDTLDHEAIKEKLIQALSRPKPFRNFKYTIDHSGQYREKWFSFKEKKLMDWISSQVEENNL